MRIVIKNMYKLYEKYKNDHDIFVGHLQNNLPLPRIPKGIKTPFGIYFPDFEYDDKYIEIKSIFTYKVFQKEILGLDKQVSKQKEKLIWVAENIKPVNIFIFDRLYSIQEIIKYPDLDITGRVL